MFAHSSLTYPHLGFGLGLRAEHYEAILAEQPAVDWFEVISENYLVPGGKPLYYLHQIRERYPLVMHGVSLSIGSSSPLDFDYLRQLKKLTEAVQPAWISDHLCWTGLNPTNLHDLLPLPYTEEALSHVVARVRQVQDFLGRRILLENLSSYVSYRQSYMTEWGFLSAVVDESDCLILLDVNNVYVNSVNNAFDAKDYLAGISPQRVQQIHLAGHQNCGDYLIDTHDEPVQDPVWELYRHAITRFGAVSTMIERDDNIPLLPELLAELATARSVASHASMETA